MKKVVKIIIVIAVLGGLVGLTYLLSGNMEQVFSSSTVYSVKTVEIGKGSISSSVSASGKIEEVDSYDVYIDNPVKVKKLWLKNTKRCQRDNSLWSSILRIWKRSLKSLK